MADRIIISIGPQEREQAYKIRRKVFIEEQHVPEELEMDEYDQDVNTQHVLLVNHAGQAVGTARFRPAGTGILKVERVAILSEQRGQGGGMMLMNTIEQQAKQSGYHCMKLSAQVHAQKFYEQLGYSTYGDVYLEAGIKHIDMLKKI